MRGIVVLRSNPEQNVEPTTEPGLEGGAMNRATASVYR
jgi:hypothetical protein